MPASVASPHRRALPAVLVVAFVALATTYNVLTPPWEAPDEFAHFGFAEHVVRHRALPVPDAADAGEAHQPPLYYAILAAAIAWVDLDDPSGRFRFNRQARIAGTGGDDVNVALHGNDESFPFRGVALAIHVGRAVSTVFGAATVLLAIALAAVVVGARGPVGGPEVRRLLVPGALPVPRARSGRDRSQPGCARPAGRASASARRPRRGRVPPRRGGSTSLLRACTGVFPDRFREIGFRDGCGRSARR